MCEEHRARAASVLAAAETTRALGPASAASFRGTYDAECIAQSKQRASSAEACLSERPAASIDEGEEEELEAAASFLSAASSATAEQRAQAASRKTASAASLRPSTISSCCCWLGLGRLPPRSADDTSSSSSSKTVADAAAESASRRHDSRASRSGCGASAASDLRAESVWT